MEPGTRKKYFVRMDRMDVMKRKIWTEDDDGGEARMKKGKDFEAVEKGRRAAWVLFPIEMLGEMLHLGQGAQIGNVRMSLMHKGMVEMLVDDDALPINPSHRLLPYAASRLKEYVDEDGKMKKVMELEWLEEG